MDNQDTQYYRPLTIEEFNSAIAKFDEQMAERNRQRKLFDKWYDVTCELFPKFKEEVEKMIREDFEKLWHETCTGDVTDNDRKSYLRQKFCIL